MLPQLLCKGCEASAHFVCYQVKLRTSVAVTWCACPAVRQSISLPCATREHLARGLVELLVSASSALQSAARAITYTLRVFGDTVFQAEKTDCGEQLWVRNVRLQCSHRPVLPSTATRMSSLQDEVQVLVEGGPALGRPHRRAAYSALGRNLCSHDSP